MSMRTFDSLFRDHARRTWPASIDSVWSPPDWVDHPRGYDVPDRGRWFPFVTGAQGVFDLMAGFAAPPGFGHDYRLD